MNNSTIDIMSIRQRRQNTSFQSLKFIKLKIIAHKNGRKLQDLE